MTGRTPRIQIESVQSVPPEAEVCDFDELDDDIGHHLSELVAAHPDEPRPSTDRSTVEDLADCSCEIVNFTGFYRIDAV